MRALLLATVALVCAPSSIESAEARNREDGATRKSTLLEQVKAKAKPEASSAPIKIVVSIRRQRLAVYEGLTRIAEAPVSTGQPGHDTPKGIFSIIEKNRHHFSNIYDNAPMPFMQRITWSGVALHAGNLPGYPASHGCIRLPYSFANSLFGQTRMGARVIIARDEIEPQPFAHPAMWKPLPPGTPALAPVAARATTDTNNVAMLIGVATATAAAGGTRTRAIVAAEREAEIARLKASVLSAETEHREAAERASVLGRVADEARAEERRIRHETEGIRRAMERTERAKAGVESQMAQLIRRNAASAETGASDRLLQSEDDLEARMLALESELDALRQDLDDQTLHAPRVIAAMQAAEDARREANGVLGGHTAKLKDAKDKLVAAERAQAKRNLPASIFVSRKTGRLYVRQGFEPIFDAPVEIESQDAPIGTHVLTAMAYAEGETALSWSALTIPDAGGEVEATRPAPSRGRGKTAEAAPPPAPVKRYPMTAASAIERLKLSPEVAERIAEIIKPGSSVVISDLPHSNETGKGTDHIVLTR